MRRAAFAIGACGLVGLLATVVIAWVAEIRATGVGAVHFVMTGMSDRPVRWMRAVPPDWPDEPVAIAVNSREGYSDTVSVRLSAGTVTVRAGPTVRLRQGMNTGLGGGTAYKNDDPRYVIDLYRAGWPWKTMERRGADDARPRAAWGPARAVQSGVTIWTGDKLPLAPVWPGFWLSSAMWAGAAGLLWIGALAPGAARRWRRRRAGRCVRCGYALAGLKMCPECGAAA